MAAGERLIDDDVTCLCQRVTGCGKNGNQLQSQSLTAQRSTHIYYIVGFPQISRTSSLSTFLSRSTTAGQLSSFVLTAFEAFGTDACNRPGFGRKSLFSSGFTLLFPHPRIHRQREHQNSPTSSPQRTTAPSAHGRPPPRAPDRPPCSSAPHRRQFPCPPQSCSGYRAADPGLLGTPPTVRRARGHRARVAVPREEEQRRAQWERYV